MDTINPKMNGQVQTEWRDLVAAYLFLGGVGAGAYVIAAICSIRGDIWLNVANVGLCLSFPLVLIGTLFLMADLGSPLQGFRAIARPGSSWISRGSLIIGAFVGVSFIHLIGQIGPLNFIQDGSLLQKLISTIGLILALGTMFYTGALLGASKGMPFWRVGSLPPLFIVSALMTGLFAVIIAMILARTTIEIQPSVFKLMTLSAAVLVLLEGLLIFSFLHSAYKLPDSRDSVLRILQNPVFIVGDVILGLVLPFVIMLGVTIQSAGINPGIMAGCIVASLCGLMGGYLLRHMILAQGMLTTLNAGGFEFRRVAYPKPPPAGIGLLPPS